MTLVMFEDQTNRRGEQRLTGDNLKVARVEFFYFALGSLAFITEMHGTNAGPSLELKTQPRFRPANLTVSVYQVI